MTSYLEIEDALRVVNRLGFHVRDAGLLASALARPATRVLGADVYPLLPMKAAAVLESVARFHALLDGNKRTAWTLMALTLWINGHKHNFTADQGFDLVLGVASGEISLEQSAALVSDHMVAR
ncbi:type II toxin-antitoxin system death-on-curing family toxin [Arthrobacter sp. Sr24]